MITNPKSIFPILVFDEKDTWESLLVLVKPELDTRGLDRLKKIFGTRTKCVVVERHYIDKDYRDTFSNFHSKRFNTPPSRCVRLHFFSEPWSEDAIAAGEDKMKSTYLGYSVIRPTKPNCIGRTMLVHTLRTDASAHLAFCKEQVHLLGTQLDLAGFPFISQDADATVCAESALWMLLRYYSNRYSWYSEALPFQITALAASHAVGRRVYPSGGLFSWQLAEALRLQRFSPMVYSRAQYPETFEHLLYTYIESGMPLLVTVPGHVVTAFGHDSDYMLKPASGAAYSSEFNRALIINDDNCFPYQTLRRNGPQSSADSEYKFEDIKEFIVPLPEKVFLPAEQARTAIETVLDGKITGILAHSPRLSSAPHLRRLFLTSSRSFKQKLASRGMGNPLVEKIYRHLPMPHFIWVCELAEVSEYQSQGKILGEVLWDATRNTHEPDGWTALHYPERLLVDAGSALNQPQDMQSFDLTDSVSYFLYKSNLHTLSPDATSP